MPDYKNDARTALNRQDVTAGPKLTEMVECVLSEVDEIDLNDAYPQDRLAEIADSARGVYTHEILKMCSEDTGLLSRTPEIGPVFDGAPTVVNIAAANLYELAYAIASERLQGREDRADEIDAWAYEAYGLGISAAKTRASWTCDGNTSSEHVTKVLDMMDKGDDVDQYLPAYPNLSGEWADDPTLISIVEEITNDDPASLEPEALMTITEAWEQGVLETFMEACENELRRHLPSEVE